MPVAGTTRAHLCRQVDGQCAHHTVTGMHQGQVEVGDMAVKRHAMLAHPLQSTWVARDKVGSHGASIQRYSAEVVQGKLAGKLAICCSLNCYDEHHVL